MKTNTITINEVLTRKQAAQYLTLSPGSLDKLPLPKIQIGRRVVFKRQDIDQWLEVQKFKGVSYDKTP